MSIQIRLRGQLTLVALENAQQAAGIDFSSTGASWECTAGTVEHIVLDLERVTWIQLRALVPLVVVVVQAVNDGGTVTVVPPSRRSAADFLRRARLGTAIATFPDKRIAVSGPPDASEEEARHDRMFPLTWTDAGSIPRGFLSTVLRHSDDDLRALPLETAMQMVTLITDELLENVREHAGASLALVAAMYSNKTPEYTIDDLLPTEQSFRRLTRQWRGSLQLSVADTGVGLTNTLAAAYPDLDDAELLPLAFDRWSSSRVDALIWKRGTRGLYRVERIARKSEGFVTARTGRHVTTRIAVPDDRPGTHRFTTTFPGTVLHVELPLESMRANEARSVLRARPDAAPMRPRIVRMPASTRDQTYAAIHGHDDELVILDASELRLDRSAAIDFLRRVSETAHPKLCAVLGLPFDDVHLEDIAHDVNEELANRLSIEAVTEVAEPVLVLGTSFQTYFWSGTHPDLVEALYETQPDPSTFHLLRPFSLLEVDDTGDMYLRFDISTVWSAAEDWLMQSLDEWTRTVPSGYIVTSALVPVREYIDVIGLLASDICMPMHPLLARLILSYLYMTEPNLIGHPLAVVVERAVGPEFAQALGRALDPTQTRGARVERVGPKDIELGRPLNFDDTSDVVCFVSAIGSGQTIRQLMANAIRHRYHVRGALALIDTRAQPGDPIVMWGRDYRVSTAVEVPLELDDPRGRRRFLDRSGRLEPLKPTPKLPSTIGSKTLSDLPGLVLGHFRGAHDYHFTFGISISDMLADRQARDWILESLLGPLVEWASALPADANIRLSQEGGESEDGAAQLTKLLLAAFNRGRPRERRLRPRRVSRSKRSRAWLSIDWGVVSGDSVMRVLQSAAEDGASHVMILRGLSIATPTLNRHLESIAAFQGDNGNVMAVRIVLGRHLPIEAYSVSTCPLCVMARQHSHHHLPELTQAASAETDRLLIRELQEASRLAGKLTPPQHVGAALQRRSQLLAATTTTAQANEVREDIEANIYDNAYLLSLCTLLLFEPQWTRRIPLSNPAVGGRVAGRIVDFLLPVQTELRPTEDVELAVVALRIVSKQHFAANLGALLTELSEPGDRIFKLVGHLTYGILNREYIEATQFPAQIEGALIRARSNIVGEERNAIAVEILDRLLDECRSRLSIGELAVLPDHQGLLRLLAELSFFSKHEFRDPLRDILVHARAGDMELASRSMERVLGWLRSRVAPGVRLFLPILRETHELSGFAPDLDAIFGRSTDLGIADVAGRALRHGARNNKRLADADFKTLNHAVQVITELVVTSKTAHSKAPRLTRAIDGSLWTVSQISKKFHELCAREGVHLVVNPGPNWTDPLVLPDHFLERLIHSVVDNTKRLAVQTPLLEMTYDSAPAGDIAADRSYTLALASRNTRRSERDPRKAGLGGLADLRTLLPGVEVTGQLEQEDNLHHTFVVRVSKGKANG